MNGLDMFKNRDKLVRINDAVYGINPPGEGLKTAQLPGHRPNDRLVIDLNVLVINGFLVILNNILIKVSFHDDHPFMKSRLTGQKGSIHLPE